MKRVEGAYWPDFRSHLERVGMPYNNTDMPDGSTMSYWQDGAYYQFSRNEVEELESAAMSLYSACIDAGDYLIDNGLLGKIGIPEWAWDAVAESWTRHGDDGDPAVYGRFDLRYDGQSPPKLLEFNADTPTCLVESAVAQWEWFQWMFVGNTSVNQWNDLEEKLIPAWRWNLERSMGNLIRHHGPGTYIEDLVHFVFTSAEKSGEDLANTALLQHYAEKAGFRTKIMHIENIKHVTTGATSGGIASPTLGTDEFYDEDGEIIRTIFKLHPWEWMCTNHYESPLAEEFGGAAVRTARDQSVAWIEPLWKMLWSNKGLLVALWEVGRDDPAVKDFLLPTYFADDAPQRFPRFGRGSVAKPLLAREGADIMISGPDGRAVEMGIEQGYGREGYVVQEFAPLPNFHSLLDGDHHPVIGLWMVEDEPAGIGIRESQGLITNNLSNFVPHVFTV
ncbi:glutathionylspermidine synthase family protein [Mycolicibacterium sp. S2-37]|uniref:glutathionylspermidine synthase family protein n=1 Tax=Mycolicibacterium sp. S2-37 TaxID=2810297 RepID=UPI001A949C04|nr:glutathionylspermidine synthase family protein [Mycolicibacterium sp. S2-37]MBO0676754.1 glutathionylspermidine synthase family protein [Mycolicibacterium sp. S2-37]